MSTNVPHSSMWNTDECGIDDKIVGWVSDEGG